MEKVNMAVVVVVECVFSFSLFSFCREFAFAFALLSSLPFYNLYLGLCRIITELSLPSMPCQ